MSEKDSVNLEPSSNTASTELPSQNATENEIRDFVKDYLDDAFTEAQQEALTAYLLTRDLSIAYMERHLESLVDGFIVDQAPVAARADASQVNHFIGQHHAPRLYTGTFLHPLSWYDSHRCEMLDDVHRWYFPGDSNAIYEQILQRGTARINNQVR
jgi:hypothetical protein